MKGGSKQSQNKPFKPAKSIKRRYGVNFRLDPKYNKVITKSKFVKEGDCVFPFKYKRATHNDCIPKEGENYTFCATSVNDKNTLQTSGICIPEGMTKKQVEEELKKIQTGKPSNILENFLMHTSKKPKNAEAPKKSKKKFKVVKKGKPSNTNGNTNGNTNDNTNDNTQRKLSKKKRRMIINGNNWIAKEFKGDFKVNDSIDMTGDCFFDSVATALEHHGIDTSIEDLRNIVKNGVTNENFQLYKELFQNAINFNDQELIKETKFIQNVDTFEDFKDFIMTKGYWADMLAMSIIEKELKIKFLLFDEDMYFRNGRDKAINCGNNLDKFTQVKCKICDVPLTLHNQIKQEINAGIINEGLIMNFLEKHGKKINPRTLGQDYLDLTENEEHKFVDVRVSNTTTPEMFILLKYEHGNHYKLVYYKDKAVLKKISKLPKNLADLIINKCGQIKAFQTLY